MKRPFSLPAVLMKADRFLLVAAFGFSMLPSPFQVFLYLSFFLYLLYFFAVPGRKTVVFGKWDIALAVLLLSGLINVFFADYKISALEGCGVFLVYFLVYLFFMNFPADAPFYGKIAFAVSLSLLLVCGFALVHHFLILKTIVIPLPWGGVYSIEVIGTDVPGRPIISILQHQMMAGNMIAILSGFIMTSLLVRFREMKLAVRVYLILVLGVAFTVLALTYARGAYLFIAVSLATLVILSRRMKLLIPLVVLALVVLFIPSEKIRNTLKDPLHTTSIPGRLLQYRAALEMYPRSNWLLGIGFLNFRFHYAKDYNNSDGFEGIRGEPPVTNGIRKLGPMEEPLIGNMPIPYVHNVYLSLLVETGLIGFTAFFAFIIISFIVSFRHFRAHGDLPSLQALVLIPGFLANSLFDNLLYTVPAGLLIWAILGLSRNPSLIDGWKTEKIPEGKKHE